MIWIPLKTPQFKMEDVNSLVRNLNSLVSKLCVEVDVRKCDEIIGQLMKMLDTIHQMSTETLENLAMEQQLQFQNSSVSLWNTAVAKSAGGTTSQLFLAKLRHLACNIAVISSLGNTNYDVLKQHLSMTSKAGSAWLDCETPAMADQCLNLALQILETLKVVTCATNQELDQTDINWKNDIKREALKVYLYKGRVCILQNHHGDAAKWVKRAKELLESIPDESGLLAMHCFNFGTDALQRKQYQACVDWLRESYELGKSNRPLEGSTLAKILRLLAKAYMEWDPDQYAQKAINAAGLANAEHSHPSGLHLKVKIILQSVATDTKLQAAIDELWSHPELTLDLATETVHLLTKHNKLNIAVKSCAELSKRFQSISDGSKLKVLQIELMIKNKQLAEARNILEQCIADSSAVNFDPSSLRNLHSLLWDQAAIEYEGNDFSAALVWYNFSYGFFTHYMEMESANLARLQRNRASCLLHLQQFKKAEEAVRDSVKHDPRNPYTHFLSFRVALCNNSPAQAIEAIKKLSDSNFENEVDFSIEPAENPVVSLISLAAQQAFETNQEVAIGALEKLAEHAKDERQLMTTYRVLKTHRWISCLFTDALSDLGVPSVKEERTRTFDVLQTLPGTSSLNTQEEASWFMKIAWNLAIENSESSELTHMFFSLCAEFCSLIGQDTGSLSRQKTCLVMAAAACLQTARDTVDQQDKLALLEQVLQLVKTCRDIYHQLSGSEGTNISDRALVLLNLYEFEALAKLGRTAEIDLFAKQIMTDKTRDIKTVETMAALAMEPPCQYKALSKKLLTVALERHKMSTPVDVTRCSKVFHSLIQLCLGDGNCNDSERREEAWSYFNDAINLIQSTEHDDYPEMEILWLMTKAWNTGIYGYGTGKLDQAVKWCRLSMRLLDHLTSFKENYQPKMEALFREISAKMEGTSNFDVKKEP